MCEIATIPLKLKFILTVLCVTENGTSSKEMAFDLETTIQKEPLVFSHMKSGLNQLSDQQANSVKRSLTGIRNKNQNYE